MAPRPLHPAMAMAPRPLNHSTLTLQWHPATAPSNGTTSTAPCNGILVPRPMRKSGSSPSPSIGSKNPYSYRYLGKKGRRGWRSGNRSFFSGQVATSVNVVGERDKCSEQNKNKAFDKNCSFSHVHIQLRWPTLQFPEENRRKSFTPLFQNYTVCTEAVHCVALWTRTLSQAWACVQHAPKHCIA